MNKLSARLLQKLRTYTFLWLPVAVWPIAALLTFVLVRNLSRPHAQMIQFPYYEANLLIMRITLFGLLALYLMNVFRGRAGRHLFVALCATLLTASMALFLSGIPMPYGGQVGDNRYALAAVNKVIHYGRYVDFYAKGLPPHYPPLIFYVTGMLARWFDLEALMAMKGVLLGCLFVIPPLTVRMWRPLLGSSRWLPLLALNPFVFADWYKPGSWIALVLLVPWWLYYVENLRRRTFRWQDYAVGGLLGGLIVHLQYFYMLVPILGFFLTLPLRWQGRYPFDGGYRFVADLRHKTLLGAASFVFAMPYIVPYVISLVRYGSDPTQNKFINPWEMNVHSQLDQTDALALLILLGVGVMIWCLPYRKVAVWLTIFVVAEMGYVFLSAIGIKYDVSLLHFKSFYFTAKYSDKIIMTFSYG